MVEEYLFYTSRYIGSVKHDIYVSNYGNVNDNGKITHPKRTILGEKVYRVIAQLFVPNPENKPEVDHIDTNRNNNRADNLRWVTHKENMNNPITLQRLIDSNKGERNGMYGKKHSDETKQKLSQKTPSMLGKHHSEETKKKMSESRKKYCLTHTVSKEVREKISKANKGNKAFLGKHHSDETRKRMSESRKIYLQNKKNEVEGT